MPKETEKKKKVFVKVTKEPAEKVAENSYVPKGLTAELISEINETTSINKRRKEVENLAKNDSISGANKAKLAGANIYMQRKEGNKEANKTRVSSGAGNPKVQRYSNPHQYPFYAPNTGEKDTYIRDEVLEKDMPVVKKTIVKVKKA
jgi:hypothetical protein